MISLSLYLFIYVYIKYFPALARKTKEKPRHCCLLQVAALSRETRESTTRKGTTRFSEVKLFVVTALTSPRWGNRKSLSSSKNRGASDSNMSLYPFQLTRERGKKRAWCGSFYVNVFLAQEKENFSIFKKKSEEVGVGGTETPKTEPS